MKKRILATAAGLILPFAVGFAAPAQDSVGHKAQNGHDKTLTVKGEIVDMACYMGHEARGKKHQKCAETCILKNNQPMGLLTDEGDVYLLVEDHGAKKPYESLKKRAAEMVSLTGEYLTRGGVQAIAVKSVQ